MTVMIDTFEFIAKLERSGLSEESAKVITKKFVEIQADFVTKDNLRQEQGIFMKDIHIIKKDLVTKIDIIDAKIDALDKKFDAKIDAVSDKLVIKMGAMITITVAIIAWLNGTIHLA
jgi:hypothetical protein